MKKHYLLVAWCGMRQRCNRPEARAWHNYGARGIKVYDGWNDDYQAFKEWILTNLGERPTPQHSLDRINNDGNYEPNNLRWATRKEQSNNRRPPKSTVYVMIDNMQLNIKQCAEYLGVSECVIREIRKGATKNRFNLKFTT